MKVFARDALLELQPSLEHTLLHDHQDAIHSVSKAQLHLHLLHASSHPHMDHLLSSRISGEV